jgi:phosphohistidine swiveling domain-containing protein
MSLCLLLKDVDEDARHAVGGKGFALARMAGEGFPVPNALCITRDAYRNYMAATGLGERIGLELHRKDFRDMRWEEIWDLALRIRNLFLGTPMPADLEKALREPIEGLFDDLAVVVRSSAPGEDSASTSFAGLHESYVNVRGADVILEHVRKVWASLWSDGALLYRQELGLDFEKSTMAVVVQEIVAGESSGVVFSRNPNDPAQAVVEAVHGLNQGLVDGTVEPDRWTLDRTTGKIKTHEAARRDQQMVPTPEGIRLEALPAARSQRAPLARGDVTRVFDLAMKAEGFFGSPQDVEWTFRGDRLRVLQSRPITTLGGGDPEGEDKRPWYLSLRRSFGNLKTLRRRIEEELIPSMIRVAEGLAGMDLEGLSDRALADEIARRRGIYDEWYGVYYRDFIPFAHGFRLFGRVYNDAVQPADPYAFIDLLAGTGLVSVSRNARLEDLARLIREEPGLRKSLEKGDHVEDGTFRRELDAFLADFQDLSWGSALFFQEEEALVRFLLEMASRPPDRGERKKKDARALGEQFLARFEGEKRAEMEELLDLGRTSYKLRDDDNIYLGRIEGQMLAPVNEGKRRIRERSGKEAEHLDPEEVIALLREPDAVPREPSVAKKAKAESGLKPRQLVGQPAGPGLARGTVRVIREASDLLEFKAGEILVCDSIDPNMTFVVPLSGGIVERRGGMLIHGAIIAREYGLPCVTGVPEATDLIHTGDTVTVDGYLGIVIIEKEKGSSLLLTHVV